MSLIENLKKFESRINEEADKINISKRAEEFERHFNGDDAMRYPVYPSMTNEPNTGYVYFGVYEPVYNDKNEKVAVTCTGVKIWRSHNIDVQAGEFKNNEQVANEDGKYVFSFEELAKFDLKHTKSALGYPRDKKQALKEVVKRTLTRGRNL